MITLVQIQSTSLVLTLIFLTYVMLILVPYLRLKPTPGGDPSDFEWHAFIPCRDEQSVIEATIERARQTFPQMHLWVIDDDSDDDTAVIALRRAIRDPYVHVVQRRRPQARTGKGDALNAAYAELSAWLPAGAQRDRVIIAVIDADGELAPNALSAVAAPDVFANPRVGAAQLLVRMKNRADRTPFPGKSRLANAFGSWLLLLQDVEFRTVITAMQALRSKTGTVGMGGNGQFTRLSVLDAISQGNDTPWHGCLLEDYELGLHVIFAGYQNRQVNDSYVSQEALPSLRKLIVQRSRWAQGNIQCVKYIPAIVRSSHFDSSGALEALYYLVLPYIQIVGFFVFSSIAIADIASFAAGPAEREVWAQNLPSILALIVIFGIGPFAIWGGVYKVRCEPETSWPRAVWIGVSVWAYQAYVVFSLFSAVGRIIRGKNGWAKTRRNGDLDTSGSAAIEA